MKKKNFICVMVLLISIISSCTHERFRIEGEIIDARDSTLYFEAITLKGIEILDSTRLDTEGRFKFSGKMADSPDFYRLRIGRKFITLAIDSTADISISASERNMVNGYTVNGSITCEKIKELAIMQGKLQEELLYISSHKTWTTDDKRENTKRSLEAYKKKVKNNYIFEVPQSAYAYFAIFQTIGPFLIFDHQIDEEDIKTFAAVSTAWELYYPNSLRSQNLRNIVIEGMKNVRKNKKKMRLETLDTSKVVVSGIIDIELPTRTGERYKLSSLKEKVILLDFTQYTHPNSPQRIIEMRKLYERYAEQGFEIYQISLDENEHFWKSSCRTLPWICVYDADGAHSPNVQSYRVTTLPEFFLINRHNELIARSTDITDLEKEIKKLLH